MPGLRITGRLNCMRRHLLAALLPMGLTVIAAATAVIGRRASAPPVSPVVPGSTELAGIAGGLSHDRAWLAAGAVIEKLGGGAPTSRDVLPGAILLGVFSGVGGIAAYNVMAKLGRPIVDHGLAIDEPIFRFVERNKADWWTAVVSRFNSIGDTWSTWGAVGSAAVCLGVSWRRQHWLPPSALGTAILVDYLSTHRLHRTIKRPGPPTSPLGTYPSGGTDRVVLFYGLIAYLLWREFSGSPRGRVWAIGGVSALSFLTAYCRQYLGEHWFIDIICGLFYGGMLLTPIVAAVHIITGQNDRKTVIAG